MTLPPPSLPPHLLRAAQIALGLGMLVLLWRLADGAEAARRLAGAAPG